MRNTEERSTRSSRPSHPSKSASAPANAFSPSFLLQASQLDDFPHSAPSRLTGGTLWSGPWDVEPVEARHGLVWAVVRKGEPLAAGGRAVVVTRHRADALLAAATLPALAVPNHLHLGDKAKRLGFPLHDGALCIGHLSRPEARIAAHLHIARTLVGHPASFALAVEALGAEEIPILGRALMRRIQESGAA